jgi:hypothetical protein
MLRGLGRVPLARFARSTTMFVLSAVALVLLKLWLVSAQPILAIGWAGHDDRLFLTLAQNLLNGDWLGQYNELTLAKGCFYPIWIALASLSGIPLLLSQHLLYLLAVLAFVLAIRPIGIPRWRLLLLAAVLWFNPGTYTTHVLRVMREGLYPALTLLVAAGFVGAMLRSRVRSRRLPWPWLLLSFLSTAAFWQTREEGVWLLPLLLALVLFVFIKQAWHRGRRGWMWGLACAVPLAAIPCSDGVVALVNKAHYGIAVSVEFKTHDFLAAYGALTRVKPKRLVPHLQVSKEMRERVYAVSPTFATLRSRLDGQGESGWGAGTRKQWPELKVGEIGGGWFVWAFREAVARAGNYKTGKKAMDFYRRMAREVDNACASKQLDCFSARATMMPPWVPGQTTALLRTLLEATSYAFGFDGILADPAPSSGNGRTQELYRKLTNDRIAPLTTLSDSRIAGWMVARQGLVEATVIDADGHALATQLQWLDSQDVANNLHTRRLDLPGADKARFDIVVPWGASIRVRTGTGYTRDVPLDGTVRSGAGPELYFYLDVVAPTDSTPESGSRMKIRVLNGIAALYQLVMPLLGLLAFLALVDQLARGLRRRRLSEVVVIQVGVLMAILARLTMLSLIELTSFPAIGPLYLTAAYPLIILFVYLALQEGWRTLGRRIGLAWRR